MKAQTQVKIIISVNITRENAYCALKSGTLVFVSDAEYEIALLNILIVEGFLSLSSACRSSIALSTIKNFILPNPVYVWFATGVSNLSDGIPFINLKYNGSIIPLMALTKYPIAYETAIVKSKWFEKRNFPKRSIFAV